MTVATKADIEAIDHVIKYGKVKRVFVKVDFVAWLKGLDLDVPLVKQAWRGEEWTACPLRVYARAELGKSVLVTHSQYTTFENIIPIPLPSWAQEFIDGVDRYDWRRVTPRECLGVLVVEA